MRSAAHLGEPAMPVQAVSLHKTAAGDHGIEFSAGTSFWVVESDVQVASDLGYGVLSLVAASTLINHGEITSTASGGAGVAFGNSGYITNEADGSIDGYRGIEADHSGIHILNLGSVSASLVGVVFYGDSTDAVLDNRGSILSNFVGVNDQSSTHGATIINSGTIEGLYSGIML